MAQNFIPLEIEFKVDNVGDEFEKQLLGGANPRIEDFLAKFEEQYHNYVFEKLLAVEIELREKQNAEIDQVELLRRFPDKSHLIRAAFENTENFSIDVAVHNEQADDEEPTPEKIGRYEIKKVLGEGGFGRVYRAYDPDTDRDVALKVPGKQLFERGISVDAFLDEARAAGRLNHPGLVTVHDVQTEGTQPYIVQEFIDGENLAEWSRLNRPSNAVIMRVIKEIAEAVGFAHQRSLYHRDLKPANILIDATGKPHVADFGLAIHAHQLRERHGERTGTPAYMSPEQVRGETHRMDGRTDIWSIGVILYELLADARPFEGKSRKEAYESIKHQEPQPLRQLDANVPSELERICTKCLEKRAADRYSSTADLIDDLTVWLSNEGSTVSGHEPITVRRDKTTTDQADTESLSDTDKDSQPLPVVPKGLRSFDRHDADFFLQLLPGPRDRHGLPESIRFWKTRIEETNPQETFQVGLIYGPSGCGKSSLVKAGLLPRLSTDVLSIYVEATPNDTEVRLLKSIARQIPDCPRDTSLPELFQLLREQPVRNRKLLIVIDQFEQWLHVHHAEQDAQLTEALRQCDGEHLQCIVMVRDDFWMPITRLMNQLEVPLLEDKTIKPVDRFPKRHAENVLVKFGQAFGSLPGTIDKKQRAFVSQAVDDLAEEGKVICVRLALFGEMMKDKPWTVDSLKAVGGTAGLGVTFLEDTFSSSSASPAHRAHQKAARAVLQSLLPESGTDIKGGMRSRQELIDASGYANKPRHFDDLIQILDSELRLITPTDPEGQYADEDRPDVDPSYKYYQLTHDYLVPSLREWLTRKLKETRRGRAQLRLTERSALWNAKPERRHLPSIWEYLNILLLTERKKWTGKHSVMMHKASRFHLTRAALVALVLAALGWIGFEVSGRMRTSALIARLKDAKEDAVLQVIDDLKEYDRWSIPDLTRLANLEPTNSDERRYQLHARMALVMKDEQLVEKLKESLLTATPAYLGPIRDVLQPIEGFLMPDLWDEFRNESSTADRRFRAGLALATYARESEDWKPNDLAFLTDELIAFNSDHQKTLRDYLRPISKRLIDPLEERFADHELSEKQLESVANALKDYSARDTARLAKLLTLATPTQYKILYPTFSENQDSDAMALLQEMAAQQPDQAMEPKQRVELGRQRAGAAITMLRTGNRQEIFDTLRVTEDPEVMTQFIHRCRQRDVTVGELVECLNLVDESRQNASGEDRKIEDRLLYAFILALGEFQLADVSEPVKDSLVKQLANWLENDPSSAIHGATSWLLRHWGHHDRVREIEEREVPYSPDREWFTLAVDKGENSTASMKPADDQPAGKIFLHFIVFPVTERFVLGEGDDVRTIRLTQPIAVTDREITWEQFEAAGIKLPPPDGIPHRAAWTTYFKRELGDEMPAFGINWFEAVTYCRVISTRLGISESDQCYPDPEPLPKREDGYPAQWPVKLVAKGLRLPTLAEWEYVCRSGIPSTYSFGDDEILYGSYGWFVDNSDEWSHPVRRLRPNIRGLFDIHGNLWEWCHDWGGVDQSNIDPMGPESGTLRVLRGGSWAQRARDCRSANRSRSGPSYRTNRLGFRIATVPSASQASGAESESTESGAAELAEPPDDAAEATAEPRATAE